MLLRKLLPALCALVLVLTPALSRAQDLADDMISLSFAFSNMPLNRFGYDPTFDFVVREFVQEDATVSANFVLTYSPVPGGLSKLTLESSLSNLLQFSGQVDFIITEELDVFLEMDTFQQLEKVLISSFKLEYEDYGFIAMMGALAQCQEQRPIAQLQQDLFDFLGTQGAESHPLWDDMLQMLRQQLEKPGKIMLSYSPIEPGSAPVHLFELLFVRHPDNYNLIWEQGQTPLLDQIPAALQWNAETNTAPCPGTDVPEIAGRPSDDAQPAPGLDSSNRKQTRNAY